MFRRDLLISSFLCLVLCGCSDSGDSVDQLKTVPASGKVTLDGNDFGPGTLDFIPVGQPGNDKVSSASAMVGEDGTFDVGTYDDDDGIVPGKYTVRLNAMDSAAETPNAENFEVTVGDSGDENIVINLKSKKSNAGTLMSPSLDGGGAGTGL